MSIGTILTYGWVLRGLRRSMDCSLTLALTGVESRTLHTILFCLVFRINSNRFFSLPGDVFCLGTLVFFLVGGCPPIGSCARSTAGPGCVFCLGTLVFFFAGGCPPIGSCARRTAGPGCPYGGAFFVWGRIFAWGRTRGRLPPACPVTQQENYIFYMCIPSFGTGGPFGSDASPRRPVWKLRGPASAPGFVGRRRGPLSRAVRL